jgi:hypothetical protein
MRPLAGRECEELIELVLIVLLVGRDTAVDCNVHGRYLPMYGADRVTRETVLETLWAQTEGVKLG